MREQELWARLEQHLGARYAHVWAGSLVMAALGDRTVIEAIAAGYDFKTIWRACWAVLELPDSER